MHLDGEDPAHPVAAGDYVALSVSDNGSGMAKEVLGKVFEPFFTTKEVGQGTGLGLSIVYGIVTQSSGFIALESEPGVGTKCRLYLPRHAGEKPPAALQTPSGRSAKGDETVLLVEDEPRILRVVGTMLEAFGYRVIRAGKPSEAIDWARTHPGDLHLLVTDVIVPEMNGPALARQIAGLFPSVRCLFISGYMDDVVAHGGVVDAGVDFLQKPFAMDRLGVKVREILDRSAADELPETGSG